MHRQVLKTRQDTAIASLLEGAALADNDDEKMPPDWQRLIRKTRRAADPTIEPSDVLQIWMRDELGGFVHVIPKPISSAILLVPFLVVIGVILLALYIGKMILEFSVG